MSNFSLAKSVTILVLISSLVSCSTREHNRNMGKGIGGVLGDSITVKFDNELTRLKNSSDTIKKPTPEMSLLNLDSQIMSIYQKSVDGNKKQQDANLSLKDSFPFLTVDIPHGSDQKPGYLTLKVQTSARKGGDVQFEFSGDINVQQGSGNLDAIKIPQVTSNNLVQNDNDVTVDPLQNQVSRPSRPTVPQATKMPQKPFAANVTCLDNLCSLMVIKLIDFNKQAFYPVLVNSMQLKGQTSTAKIKLISPAADQLKSVSQSKNVPTTSNNRVLSLNLPESTFDIQAQTIIPILTQIADVRATIARGGANADLTIEASADVSPSQQVSETDIEVNPKK